MARGACGERRSEPRFPSLPPEHLNVLLPRSHHPVRRPRPHLAVRCGRAVRVREGRQQRPRLPRRRRRTRRSSPADSVRDATSDGATDEGVYAESLNFAALKKLPILFICENNGYAIYSSVKQRMPADNFCERAESYRIPASRIESGVTREIGVAAEKAIKNIRDGKGPQFLECLTARWRDHVGPDEDRIWNYRSNDELDDWIKRDEMAILGSKLTPDIKSKIDAAVEQEIVDAITYAEESQFPDVGELLDHVFR